MLIQNILILSLHPSLSHASTLSFPPLILFSFHFPLVFRFLFCPSYASSSNFLLLAVHHSFFTFNLRLFLPSIYLSLFIYVISSPFHSLNPVITASALILAFTSAIHSVLHAFSYSNIHLLNLLSTTSSRSQNSSFTY